MDQKNTLQGNVYQEEKKELGLLAAWLLASHRTREMDQKNTLQGNVFLFTEHKEMPAFPYAQ